MIQSRNQRTGRPDVLPWCSSALRIVLFFLLLLAQTLFVATGFAQSSEIKPTQQSSAQHHHQSSRRHVHRSTMPTPTPTLTSTSSPSPDFRLHITGPDRSVVTVGTPVSFSLAVCNSGDAAEIFPAAVSITGVIPAGLTAVSVAGKDWSVSPPNILASTSPGFYSERYTGSYPILAGQCLPTLTISGTLTLDAIPLFTLQATVAAAGDFGDFAEDAKLDSVSLTVISATPTPTPTPTPIPTAIVSGSPTATPVDLMLQVTTAVGATATVGSAVTFAETICNLGGDEAIPNAIELSGVIPAGIADLRIGGADWTLATLSANVGPAVYSATYTGPYPVGKGTCLPTLLIAGTLQPSALPALTLQGVVTAPGDTQRLNNSDSVTLQVTAKTATPTAEATMLPTATTLVTPTGTVLTTPSVVATPDLALSLTGTTQIQVGQLLRYAVNICNKSNTVSINDPRSIVVDSVLPLGLSHIAVAGANWQVANQSSLIGPALLTINYTGASPIAPHGCLGPLYISGVVTSDAQPVMTVLASVTTQNDLYAFNNSSMLTAYVSPALVLLPTKTKTVCKSCANAFCRCSFRSGF